MPDFLSRAAGVPANGEIEAISSERHAPAQSKSTLVGALLSGSGGRIRTDDLQVMSLTSCHCSTPQRIAPFGDAAGIITYGSRVPRNSFRMPTPASIEGSACSR